VLDSGTYRGSVEGSGVIAPSILISVLHGGNF